MRTTTGRPKWDDVFGPISRQHMRPTPIQIGVFYCGPDVIKHALGEMCQKWSRVGGASSPDFIMHSEKF